MSHDLVIFGVGDYARVAHAYLQQDSAYRTVAFTVHRRYVEAPTVGGVPVVPFESLRESHPPDRHSMLVAVGFSRVNRLRTEIYEETRALGYQHITYVNSRAYRWGEVEVGDNTFVFEANVLQPNVRIGRNVVLWSGNHIGHDTTIGDHCFIASHAVISGNVTIGHSCFVGVNATFRDGITVAPRCVIGAGALIMKDTEEGEVYAVRGTQAIATRSWDLRGF
jgi:sugar O-acyltransferase (sialic acid O-acetyltransferase NeuD family)